MARRLTQVIRGKNSESIVNFINAHQEELVEPITAMSTLAFHLLLKRLSQFDLQSKAFAIYAGMDEAMLKRLNAPPLESYFVRYAGTIQFLVEVRKHAGKEVSGLAYTELLNAWAKSQDAERMQAILGEMERAGIPMETGHFNALLLAQSGFNYKITHPPNDREERLAYLQDLEDRATNATATFTHMMELGVEPDAETYAFMGLCQARAKNYEATNKIWQTAWGLYLYEWKGSTVDTATLLPPIDSAYSRKRPIFLTVLTQTMLEFGLIEQAMAALESFSRQMDISVPKAPIEMLVVETARLCIEDPSFHDNPQVLLEDLWKWANAQMQFSSNPESAEADERTVSVWSGGRLRSMRVTMAYVQVQLYWGNYNSAKQYLDIILPELAQRRKDSLQVRQEPLAGTQQLLNQVRIQRDQELERWCFMQILAGKGVAGGQGEESLEWERRTVPGLLAHWPVRVEGALKYNTSTGAIDVADAVKVRKWLKSSKTIGKDAGLLGIEGVE
jgi:hypothetical protein